MNVNEIVAMLNRGILPDELNFKIQQNEELDWSKVKYNSFYKSYEYHKTKFPKGLESLSVFDDLVNYSIENAKTPLEEMTKRQSEEDPE